MYDSDMYSRCTCVMCSLNLHVDAAGQGRNSSGFRDEDCTDDKDEDDERLPPHELLAREYARSHRTTFSVCEGLGRTLKGRDLSRVRNAVWSQMGFAD